MAHWHRCQTARQVSHNEPQFAPAEGGRGLGLLSDTVRGLARRIKSECPDPSHDPLGAVADGLE
jgi:hypothetical protein